MDIVVFGAGALGSLVGGLLAREHHVTLVARDPHARRVAGEGLRVVGELDAHTQPRATTDPTPADLTCDLALVTVKAYDAEAAGSALAAGDPEVVCSLSNGLTEETLAEALGDRVLAGSATYGAELVGPGEVRCTGAGRIHVGEFAGTRRDSDESDAASDRAERVAAAFREAGLDCTADPAMPRRRWEKLAVNAGINAVTALARVPNGALADGPGRAVAHRAARETARVARAEESTSRRERRSTRSTPSSRRPRPTARRCWWMCSEAAAPRSTRSTAPSSAAAPTAASTRRRTERWRSSWGRGSESESRAKSESTVRMAE